MVIGNSALWVNITFWVIMCEGVIGLGETIYFKVHGDWGVYYVQGGL